MKLFKIRLELLNGILTPFHADTLFGHLCWVIAHREGDKQLKNYLQPFKEGSPRFIISDGFPEDLLPKPLSADYLVDDLIKSKELKKSELVIFDDFNKIRKYENFEFHPPSTLFEKKPLFSRTLMPHNRIDRLTNTTPDEGGVYSLEEMHFSSISIYLKTVNEDWKNRIVSLLEELSQTGYGRKKSIGKGHFSVKEVIDFSFPGIENPNGFVTLSNFCPAENDPVNGLYKTIVKYGKLGEEYTFCGNPFKRPMVMIKTGSIFKTDGQTADYYGRMIENISPAKPEVVQYAYAFAIPIKMSCY
jgi:CRISPR-associated protein Csm4